MNKKICYNCNSENAANVNYCFNCGCNISNISNQNITENNNHSNYINEKKEGNKLALISIFLEYVAGVLGEFIAFFLPSGIREILSMLFCFCPMAGIIVLIYGKVKYPKNKFIKALIIFNVISFVLGLIACIALFYTFIIACGNMDTSGCN